MTFKAGTFMQEYKKKLISPEQAAQLVKSGDWIQFGEFVCQPKACDAGKKPSMICMSYPSTFKALHSNNPRDTPPRTACSTRAMAGLLTCGSLHPGRLPGLSPRGKGEGGQWLLTGDSPLTVAGAATDSAPDG